MADSSPAETVTLKHTITINEEQRGKRTDKFLADWFPQFPRTALHKLFESEHVLLNDKPVKPGIKLRIGDRLSADLTPLDIKIEDIELPILYEDDDVLVINKPSGVISHARGRFFDEASVASFVRQKVTRLTGERAGIVHRLDRATSGVMVCAKNQDAMSWLQKQFSDRKVHKTYTAIVNGEMPSVEGIIDMPIGRNPAKPQTFIVTAAGKSALTRYTVLSATPSYSMIELRPETGRTHQLRVHLHELHHPIVGDILYGGEEAPRLLLHASKLEIVLPSKETMTFSAPLPDEFKEKMDV
jgi:23S rRNA pseudouridine1911/1915/1917 synthase